MSGWKLLYLLAASASPALVLDELPSERDVHTNVVAGFLSDDNRTVVARLPQAEVGFAPFTTFPKGLFPQGGAPAEPEFTFVFSDGRRVAANFVGLDAATGLSVLEAVGPITPEPRLRPAEAVEPSVGQRLVLYAPAPVARGRAPAPQPPSGGQVYASIGRAEAQMTGVVRTPSGQPYSVTARAPELSPAWAGAVATDGTGRLVGIASRSEAGQTQIVPAEALYRAVDRVRALRTSVPQPWLGARGDAAFKTPLETWVNRGWEPERAAPLIRGGQGVLITSVAPGTPAALAGMRSGDLISRVNGREVKSVQDLSLMLKELPVGSEVEFTVLRAPASSPVNLPVLLSGTQNPALATAEAEARAARETYLSLRAESARFRAELEKFGIPGPRFDAESHAATTARLREVESKLTAAARETAAADRRVFEARARSLFDLHAVVPSGPPGDFSARSLLAVGARAIALTPRGAAPLGANGGALVVSVMPSTPAAACGLRPGDVIETAGGRSFTPVAFGALLRDASERPVPLGIVRSGRKTTLPFSLSCEQGKQD